MRRFDYLDELHTDPKRTDGVFMHEDPTTGFLHADTRPARIGVLKYRDAEGNVWGELRTEDEVFDEDSLRSYDLATVTNDHPADFVTVHNRDVVDVGSVGNDARRDGRFVRVSIVVRDLITIQDIKDGKVQLSCGYTAKVVPDSGHADGLEFAGRQTNIRINHIAIVDKGRAGPECSVLARGDAFHLHTTGVAVPTKKIKIGDAEYEVDPKVADAIDALRNDHEQKLAEALKKASDTSLQAKLDVLETKLAEDAKSFGERVDARSKLIATATGMGIKTDGMDEAALMRAVVLKVLPQMEAKLDANKASDSYLRASYDNALEVHTRRDRASREANEVVFAALTTDGKDVFEEALTAYASRGGKA